VYGLVSSVASSSVVVAERADDDAERVKAGDVPLNREPNDDKDDTVDDEAALLLKAVADFVATNDANKDVIFFAIFMIAKYLIVIVLFCLL